MKAYEAVFPARGCTVDLFSTPPLNKSNVGGLSLVCYTAPPQERCVTTLKTAV